MTQAGDALAAELDRVAQRVLPRAFTKHGKEGPLELPKLQAVADHVFPGSWGVDGLAALEKLLRLAIGRLEGSYHGNLGRKEAAYILFNLDAPELGIDSLQLEGLDGRGYPYLLAVLKSKTNTEHQPRGLARATRDLRLALARIMLDPQFGSEPDRAADKGATGQVSPGASQPRAVTLKLPQRSRSRFHAIVGDKMADKPVAIDFLVKKLPQVATGDIGELIDYLGSYSTLVAQAVIFLEKNPDISARDLMTSFARDAALVIDMLHATDGPSLTALLRRFVEILEANNPDALALLTLLTFGAHSSVPYELAGAFLLGQQTVDNEEAIHASLALRRALEPLLSFGFVTSESATIEIDQLAQNVLASLLDDRFDSFVEKARVVQCDRDVVSAAGWGPLSSTGRTVFFEVVNNRILDRQNANVRRRRGEFYGPEWDRKVTMFWLDALVTELPFWARARFTGNIREDVNNEDAWSLDLSVGALQKAEAIFTKKVVAVFVGMADTTNRTSSDGERVGITEDEAIETVDSLLAAQLVRVNRSRLDLRGDSSVEDPEWQEGETARIFQQMDEMKSQLRSRKAIES